MKKLLIFTPLLLSLLLLICACGEENSETADTLPETFCEETSALTNVTDAETEAIASTETESSDAITEPVTLPAIDTEAATEISTEALTEAPTESPIDALLEAVMSQNQMDDLREYHITTDMRIDLSASMNGMETTMALTGGLQMIQSSDHGMALQLQLPTMEPYALVYIDGMMYVTSAEGKFRCPMTEVELALVGSELLGDLFMTGGEMPESGMSILPNEMSGLLSSMKISALFAESELLTDEVTGDTTVTLKGISPQVQLLLKLLSNSMEMPELEGISNMDLSLILDTLSTFDMDALTLSLTVDKDLAIKASTLVMGLDMLNAPDLVGDIPVTVKVTLDTTLDRSPQTVSAPEDADTYTEIDWRSLFGIYTAEYLGLVPDANGVITLSKEPDALALQYQYISQNQKDFEGVTFSLTAHALDFEVLENGTARGTLYQVYEDGTSAYYPYLYVCFPADLADGMTLPEDGSTVTVTAKLAIASEGESYYDLIALSYQFVSASTVVG